MLLQVTERDGRKTKLTLSSKGYLHFYYFLYLGKKLTSAAWGSQRRSREEEDTAWPLEKKERKAKRKPRAPTVKEFLYGKSNPNGLQDIFHLNITEIQSAVTESLTHATINRFLFNNQVLKHFFFQTHILAVYNYLDDKEKLIYLKD